jgi:large subunit ribosomal protein L25
MSNSSERVVVAVETRDNFGKNACRRLRAAGKIPANVYGMGMPSFPVAVDPRGVEEVLRMSSGRNTIFTLSLAGGEKNRAVMLREMQRDPVNEKLTHVDFVRVDPDKRIHVRVPVRLVGIPEGVKNEAGLMDFVHREVEVACLPASIPEHLDVDVSHLHNNQHVSVKELHVEEGVEIVEDPETILAVVAAPRVEIVEAPAEEEAEAAAEAAPEDEAAAKKGESTEESGAK